MAYTNNDGADVTKPDGATSPLNTVDTIIQGVKAAYNERLATAFGGTWGTATEANIDKLYGVANFFGTGKQSVQAVVDLGNITGTVALDFDARGNYIKATLTGNVTFTVTNMRPGTTYVLFLVQNGTGGYSITLPAGLRTPGGAALSFNTTANRASLVSIVPYSSTVGLVSLAGTNYNVS